MYNLAIRKCTSPPLLAPGPAEPEADMLPSEPARRADNKCSFLTFCTHSLLKDTRTKNETKELMVYCAILPRDDIYFQIVQYISKSFNTVNDIAQSFNRTYKHPISLRNLKYCSKILTV